MCGTGIGRPTVRIELRGATVCSMHVSEVRKLTSIHVDRHDCLVKLNQSVVAIFGLLELVRMLFDLN